MSYNIRYVSLLIMTIFIIIFFSYVEWLSLFILITMLLFYYSLHVFKKKLLILSLGLIGLISALFIFLGVISLSMFDSTGEDMFDIIFPLILIVYAIANLLLALSLYKTKAKNNNLKLQWSLPLLTQYKLFWTQSFNFTGVTKRNDYWFAIIGHAIFSFIIGLLIETDWLLLIYLYLTLIPSWAITIRRLRDVGKKWTYILIGFIPLIGQLFLLITLCAPSQSDVVNTMDIE